MCNSWSSELHRVSDSMICLRKCATPGIPLYTEKSYQLRGNEAVGVIKSAVLGTSSGNIIPFWCFNSLWYDDLEGFFSQRREKGPIGMIFKGDRLPGKIDFQRR